MIALFNLINTVFSLYLFIIFVSIILSWLIAFDVVNMRNQLVRTVYDVTNALTEPLLRPIRRLLPDMGGIDLSPLILILLLYFLRDLIMRDLFRMLMS